MSELVEQLLSSAEAFRNHNVYTSDGEPIRLIVQAEECKKAADRIATLEAENTQLREALGYYADTFCELGEFNECCGKLRDDDCSGCKARAALASCDIEQIVAAMEAGAITLWSNGKP